MFRQTLAFSTIIFALTASMTIAADESKPGAAPDPAFIIGQVRIQDSKGFEYFYVSGSAKIEQMPMVMGQLMGKLYAAVGEGKIVPGAAPVAIYTSGATPADPVNVQVGIPTETAAKPAGDAKVRKVETKRCASLIYIGSVRNIAQAYQALDKAVKEKKLTTGEEWREYYLYWADNSPNNVIMIQATLKD